jgi:multiple sugar transport system ATP-binding protein
MIYVTHDQVEAMTLGNRIAVLNKGKLMQLDTPLHLYNYPGNRFVAGFIGSPTMNFLKGTIQKQDKYFFINESAVCKICIGSDLPMALEKYIGKPIQIGVRPEHIYIQEEGDDCLPDCTLKVIAYENMGNEQLVYLSFGEQTLIARRPSRDEVEVGKENAIRFSADKLIYIDAASGDVIKLRAKAL